MAEGLDFDIDVTLGRFRLAATAGIPLSGITALTGPSGGGKTTLLRVLSGLERRGRARVSFAGDDWSGTPPHTRGIGYVFQEPRLFGHLDVAGNLAYGARRRGADSAHVAQVVAALGLEPLLTHRPATLSGGEARRVALGRALAARPRILFLDEPLTGLDEARKAEMRSVILEAVRRFSIPAIFVSHLPAEIAALADRELALRDGRITGWVPPPPGLDAVLDGQPGAPLALRFGDMLYPLGEMPDLPPPGPVRLVLGPGSYLVSDRPPGRTNAALVIEARLTDPGPAGTMTIDVAGQRLVLPEIADIAGAGAGTRLWLSIVSCSVCRATFVP